eukprot:2879846-Prymnesium_polylepis.1
MQALYVSHRASRSPFLFEGSVGDGSSSRMICPRRGSSAGTVDTSCRRCSSVPRQPRAIFISSVMSGLARVRSAQRLTFAVSSR